MSVEDPTTKESTYKVDYEWRLAPIAVAEQNISDSLEAQRVVKTCVGDVTRRKPGAATLSIGLAELHEHVQLPIRADEVDSR